MRTIPDNTPAWVKPLITPAYAALIGLMTLYVGWRLDRWIFAALRLDFTFGLIVLLGAFFLLHVATARRYMVAWDKLSTYLVGVSTFCMIWLTVGFGAVDLWAFLTHRRTDMDFVRQSGKWILIAVAALTLISWLWRKVLLIRELTVPLTDGPCRVVMLSDLHIGYYVGLSHMRKVVRAINAQHPDMVIIAGDLINAGNVLECGKIDKVAQVLAAIKAPTYAVLGNHDPDPEDEDLIRFLQAAKINLLEDTVYHAEQFDLVGRTSCTRPRKTMAELLPERTRPVIVADHDPQGIDEAAQAGADLVLCGHTHAGQVFPLNLFVRAVYSKEETYGSGKRENTWTYVTSGAGYFSMPMRLGSTCEIVTLDLEDPQKQEAVPEETKEGDRVEKAEDAAPKAEAPEQN